MTVYKQNFLLLFAYSYILVITVMISNGLLNFDEVLYYSLIENLNENQIEKIFNIVKFTEKLNFIIFPVIVFIKMIIISTILQIGILFNNSKVKFKEVLNIALKSELIFLLVGISKIIWFYFFQTGFTLEDLQCFYPLSALNIIGYKGLDTWLIYPLQVLNLFEIAYIIYLSYQIGYLTKTNADNGLKIVASSYIPALVLWVFVVMFFTLNYS